MQAIGRFVRSLTLKPQGVTMIVAAFLPVFAIIAMFPVVGAIIAHFKNEPDAAIKVPAMVTAPGYAIALLAPFVGLAVDRFGRRRLLLACTFVYGLVGALPILLESLNAIIASRLLLGVCEAGILTTVNTLIADYWDDRERRNWLMLQGIVGPALQPLVFLLVAAVAAVRWNGGFLVYLIAFPIFISMFFCVFEPKPPEESETVSSASLGSSHFPWRQAAQVAALTLVASVIYYVFIVNGSLTWREIGVSDPMRISKVTFVPSLFILAGSVLFRIVSRYPNTMQIAVFFALFGLGLIGIGLATTIVSMQLALVVQQTGAGMAVPALIAWAQSKFDFAHRGRGMGVWTSAFFLGQAISPLIMALVAARTGSMQAAFALAGGVALGFGVIAALMALRAPRRALAA